MADINEKNDILALEWTSLNTVWLQCREAVTDKKLQEKLDGYFSAELPQESGAGQPQGSWERLNLAEQMVGLCLDADQLPIEYDNLMELATSHKLGSLQTFENYRKQLFPTPAPAGPPLKQQRTAYLALLYALQSVFVSNRFERQLKGSTAWRLFILGSVLLAITVAVHLTKGFSVWPKSVDAYRFAAVIGMGVLGAFFSRLTAFQTSFPTLQFVDITEKFHRNVLLVRLLVGGIGALIFYYLLRSGLFSNSIIPSWCKLDMTPCPAGSPSGDAATEWCKLFVWSFVAGFSERLVSNSLDKIGST